MKRKNYIFFVAIVALFMITPSVFSRTIYVREGAKGLGRNWDDAYGDFQDALAVAYGGDQIWVASGIYFPSELTDPGDPRSATFRLVLGVNIYGGFDGTETTIAQRNIKNNPTILSGDIGIRSKVYDNCYHVVTADVTAGNVGLDGFIITNGNANGTGTKQNGGGIYNVSSGGVNISNCTFIGNRADNMGGAMYCFSQFGGNYPTLTNCKFIQNQTSDNGTGGAGIFNDSGSNPTLRNCLFYKNSAGPEGAAAQGGAIYNSSIMTIYNCTLISNSAFDTGGLFNYGSVIIKSSIFWANTELQSTGESAQISTMSTMSIDYSCVQGWTGEFEGTGNIGSDPVLKDFNGHIWNTSPCKNAGDPTAYGPSMPQDFDGDPRVLEGRIDMGVDELPPSIQNANTMLTYTTLQSAINGAVDGDTIIVQDGTYYPSNNGIDFLGKKITLKSSDPTNPEVVARTIIDGTNELRGFYFHSSEGQLSVLSGFKITNCISLTGNGGAILCNSSSPLITNCLITGNTAPYGAGGGIFCYNSSPVINNCIISNNSALSGGGISCNFKSKPTINNCLFIGNTPDAILLADAGSSVLIDSSNKFISNDIVGSGSIQLQPDTVLNASDISIAAASITGTGTIQVDPDTELIIDEYTVVDLTDPDDPDIKGTINCEGILTVKQNALITNSILNLTMASFIDNVTLIYCEIYVNSHAPYGQFYFGDNATVTYNDIYADGDRYMDLDPSIFTGIFENNRIFVTITEGVGKPQGGLLELRGSPDLVDTSNCDPDSFLCQINSDTVPDCNDITWTLEKLRLIEGSKINLTNRFPFEPPYDSGGYDEVLYVKELIMEPNSILNTSFNKIYYQTAVIDPTAQVKDIPLLGFSLINITFDDETEYIVRVSDNNFTHPANPDYNRQHVQRVTDELPDPAGMMRMKNLRDNDPASPEYLNVKNARAKGLFSKTDEDEVLILFEYLFETNYPEVELVIYLSDVPEMLDHNDPQRSAHYLEVARLRNPLAAQSGTMENGKFGVFREYFDVGNLNFVRGTYLEFELIGPHGSRILINNWDPQVHCSDYYCGDVTGDTIASAKDFLTVISSNGETAGLDNATGTDCLDGVFSSDGYVDIYDTMSWDWALCDNNPGNFCGVSLDAGGQSAASYSPTLPQSMNMNVPLIQPKGAILVAGKINSNTDDVKMQDALYSLTDQGNFVATDYLTQRTNGKLIKDSNGNLYQVNLHQGLVQITDSNSVVVPSASITVNDDPRYHGSAEVNIGIQDYNGNPYGRPIFDAAFDRDGYVYIVPAVVTPQGNGDTYTAAAKLRLLPGQNPPYQIEKLFDDPDAAAENDNRNLSMLREIEADDMGNIFVTNGNRYNQSDILWKYDSSTGDMINRLTLNGDPNVPAPVGMFVSQMTNTVYMASGQADPESSSVTVKGFSTNDLSLVRTVTIHGMGHLTGITEDPATGNLWAVGFKMTNIPEYLYTNSTPFYEPYIAEIPSFGDTSVTALNIADTSTDPNNNLAMPVSIVWTADPPALPCEGANLDKTGSVDLADFAIIASQWKQTGNLSADIAPLPVTDNIVDIQDLAVIAKYWLNENCP